MDRNKEFYDLLEILMGRDGALYLEAASGNGRDWFRFNPLKFDLEFQHSLLLKEGFVPERAEGFGDLWSVKRPSRGGRGIGKSLSHFLGNIYIQNPASMMPPLILDPQPGETVLDLCAAPGSKTSMLASLMQGKGLLAANDRAKRRLQALVFNLRRCGVPNALCFSEFGEHFGNLYYEHFDRVLVDPPCSALGTVGKNPEVLSWWNRERSLSLSRVQLSLLISGIKALKPGGLLVYSTCTITAEENEGVLDQVLRKFPLELENIRIPGFPARPALQEFEGKRFHPETGKAVRLYPHETGTEGFFIACIRKTGRCGEPKLNQPRRLRQGQLVTCEDPRVSGHLAELEEKFGLERAVFADKAFRPGKNLNWLNEEALSFPCYLPISGAGYPLAHIGSVPARLTTEAIHAIGDSVRKHRLDLEGTAQLQSYVNRREVDTAAEDCDQAVVFYDGHPIGHGLVIGGKLLSRFPRIGWEFQFMIDD